mmetsp:Transcript_1978/g.5543  ORF Transcript_1978/g.5543 Transcript_1978/m.5543 type:complete len:648 (+) Transcript_1978:193-2136(+)
MREQEARPAMIKYLWAGQYATAFEAMGNALPVVHDIIECWTENTYTPDDDGQERRAQKQHMAISILVKTRNKNWMPFLTVILSLMAYEMSVPEAFTDLMTLLGLCASRRWTYDLVEEARRIGPPLLPFETLNYVGAAVCDNKSWAVNYKSMQTSESDGTRLEMMNWAVVHMPASAYPHSDARLRKLFNVGGGANTPTAVIFKQGFDKYSIIPLISHDHVDISRNKNARFLHLLVLARDGRLLDRPDYQPSDRTYFKYMKPIWDRMQSSYDDVREELEIIRSAEEIKWSQVVFVGGDGLTYMRQLHLIKQDPAKYIGERPQLIPILGDHPHGVSHTLHAGFRVYAPFINEFMQAIDHTAYTIDFNVSDFETNEFAFHIIFRACAEYTAEVGAGRYDDVVSFIETAEQNEKFGIVVHFLYDFAFAYWQLRQAVRSNDAAHIRLVWRELVLVMHSATAHKTNYAPMALNRVFWDYALHDDLSRLLDNMYTLSLNGLPGRNVGWDMPIEKLNLLLVRGVQAHVTRERIEKVHISRGLLGERPQRCGSLIHRSSADVPPQDEEDRHRRRKGQSLAAPNSRRLLGQGDRTNIRPSGADGVHGRGPRPRKTLGQAHTKGSRFRVLGTESARRVRDVDDVRHALIGNVSRAGCVW